MTSRFEDLWDSAADDGASCPVGLDTTAGAGGAEIDHLMNAWLSERTERIEGSLVLDQARRLLAGMLAGGELTPRRRRQARRLIRAIRCARGGGPGAPPG